MAKWLNKYFSLGNNKTKSPPQPPRPDYREKRNGAGGAPRPDGPPHLHRHQHHASPGFPHRHLRDDTSELLRAYRAQKDRDFEDPYSGPGSSLRKLRALCRPEPCAPDEPGPAAPRAFSSASCGAAASAPAGSPLLARSQSERRPGTPPEVRYISPRHRLIRVEIGDGGKFGRGGEQLAASAPAKEKVSAGPGPALRGRLWKWGRGGVLLGELLGWRRPLCVVRIVVCGAGAAVAVPVDAYPADKLWGVSWSHGIAELEKTSRITESRHQLTLPMLIHHVPQCHIHVGVEHLHGW